MSNLSYMDKLLDGVEVEWKTLGEVFTMRAGRHISASQIMEESDLNYTYPCFGGNGVRGFVDNQSHDGSHLIIGRQGALCGNVQRVKGEFYATEHAVVVTAKDDVNIDWGFHMLTLMNLNQYASKSAQPGLVVGKIAMIKIPIPPLNIQTKIVRILDAFTELTAELTAELVARKRQYTYYRDQLLTFNDDEVEMKLLGEVGAVRMCKRVLKSQTSDSEGIPFYKIGTFGKEPNAYITRELFDEYKTKYSYPQIGEVLISASGTIGRTVIFDGRDAYFQDSNIVWIENNESKVLNKYLFYFYQVVNWNVAEGGTIKRLYNDNLRKIKIPIPPLIEQQRIVTILDKFDALTTSLTEGLPREIALRQQQYEYYRELLLSFPKTEVADND